MQKNRLAAAWVLVLGCAFSSVAGAEAWREVRGLGESEYRVSLVNRRISVDDDSVAAGERPHEVRLRYRSTMAITGDPADQLPLEYQAAVDCADLSMRVSAIQGIKPSYSIPLPLGSWKDPIALNPLDGLGQMALAACEKVAPAILAEQRRPSDDECAQGAPGPEEFALCKNRELRSAIGLARSRVIAVAKSCGTRLYERAIADSLNAAKACIGVAKCVRRALAPMGEVDHDYAALLRGQNLVADDTCASAASLSSRFAKVDSARVAQQDIDEARADLVRCAGKAARRLDDGRTGAEHIARAAVATCKAQAQRIAEAAARADQPRDAAAISDAVTTDLIAEVLTHRASHPAAGDSRR